MAAGELLMGGGGLTSGNVVPPASATLEGAPFSWSLGTTPVVNHTSEAGGVVTIVGSGFGALSSGNVVHIGSIPAALTSASTERLVANLPSLSAGTHKVRVNVTGQGEAVSTATVFKPLVVSSLTPTAGSFNGGQDIIITGSGFGTKPGENNVTVGGIPCSVTASSTTSIQCTTGSFINKGAAHTAISKGIQSSTDDAVEYISTGKVRTDLKTLTLPLSGSSKVVTGLRITGVDIERGAVVHSARVQLQVKTKSDKQIAMHIRGELTASAAPFSKTKNNLTARNKTVASVLWEPTDWNVFGVLKYTADLSPVIREIVAQPGWVKGGDIALFFTHHSGDGTRVAFSYDYYRSGAAAPIFSATHTPPTSAALLAYEAVDTKACAVTVELEHEDSYEGAAKCASVQELTRGRPTMATSRTTKKCSPVHVEVGSGGWNDANFATIAVNGKAAMSTSRGINIVVLSGTSHKVISSASFDTYWIAEDSERLAAFVNRVTPGDIVLASVMSDGQRMLEPIAREAFRTIGASMLSDPLGYGESYALIAVKGTTSNGGTGSAAVNAVKAFAVEKRAKRFLSASRGGVTLERAFGCASTPSTVSRGDPTSETDWLWMLNVQRSSTFDPMVSSDGLGVDGDQASYWLAIGEGQATWEVDLGSIQALAGISVGFVHPPLRMALLTSTDRVHWKDIYNTDEISAEGSTSVSFDGQPPAGRYLRLFMAGSQKAWLELSDGSSAYCDVAGKSTLPRSSACHSCSWAAASVRSGNETSADWASRLYSTVICGTVSSPALLNYTAAAEVASPLLNGARVAPVAAANALCAYGCRTIGSTVSPLCTCKSVVSTSTAAGFSSVGVVQKLPLLAIGEVEVKGCGRTMTKTLPAASGFTYSKSLTASVTSVLPKRGSTAGGTDLTIVGTGFGTTASSVTVSVAGVACAVSAVIDTQVKCTTGYHGPTNQTNTGKAMVLVKIAGKGHATAAADTYWYVDLWSRTTTWGGNAPPIKGDSVEIPRGQTVMLDVCPPELVAIIIMGKLVFDRKDLCLDARYIIVLGKGAALEVGTESEPFLHKAVITMHGHAKSPELPVYGAKVIAVREGTLDLHGKPMLRSWTQLAANAHNGTTSITLIKPVDWPVGADIVIASTDFEKEHAESVTITSRSSDGLTIGFSPALKYLHLGETRTVAGHKFEYRAEVGLLSRNVVIQGDQCSLTCSTGSICKVGSADGITSIGEHSNCNSAVCSCDDTGQIPSQYGVQIFSHSHGDESLTTRIENIEVQRAGQAFKLGRYPIHFHMIGTVHNSYARNNSVHHTFNRGFTIHGVHHLRVQDNVAYHTRGHTFFIEDSIETKNRVEGNLGVLSFASNALLNTDQTPAMFWITNPDNIIRNNHAAGAQNYGFWYRAEGAVNGASAAAGLGDGTCPKGTPLLEFKGNTAHSNGRYGFRLYDEFNPRAKPCSRQSATNPYVTARFQDCTLWRNRVNNAQISAGSHLVFQRFFSAEGHHAGIEMPNVQGGYLNGEWGTNQVVDSIIVGRTTGTDNWQGPAKGRPSLGIEVAAWHRLLITNTTFSNFDRPTMYALGALPKESFSPLGGGWEARFSKIRWGNSPRRFWWEHPHESFYTDLDGTLSGTGVAGTTVLPYNDLLPSFAACRNDSYSSGSWIKGGPCVPNPAVGPKQAGHCDGTAPMVWPRSSSSSGRRLLGGMSNSPGHPGAVCTATTFRRVAMNDVKPVSHDFKYLKVAYQPPGQTFVSANDTAYLKDKWRIQGEYYLVKWTEGAAGVTVAPEITYRGSGFWKHGFGNYTSSHTMNMTLENSLSQLVHYTTQISPDRSVMTWSDGSKPWINCSALPLNCTGPTRYNQTWMKVIYHLKRKTKKKGYVFNVPTGHTYDMEWDLTETDRADTQSFKMDVSDMKTGDHFWLRMVHQQHMDHLVITSSVTDTNGTIPPSRIEPSGFAEEPGRAKADGGKFGDWVWDNKSMTSTFLVAGRNGNPKEEQIEASYKMKPCPSTWCGCKCKTVNELLGFDGTVWKWSDPKTWAEFGDKKGLWTSGSTTIPGEKDFVVIPKGKKVLLDVTTARLGQLEVGGVLEVSREHNDLSIRTVNMVIRGSGRFIIGNSTHPYTNRATVLLFGDRLASGFRFNSDDYGAKSLVNFGSMDIFGARRSHRWAKMASTAAKGATSITMAVAVDWKAGDRIVLSPTDYDTSHVDDVLVTGASTSGGRTTLTLAAPLQWKHFVGSETYGNKTMHMSCEVMLASSNVQIRGADHNDWPIYHSLHEQEFGASIVTAVGKSWDAATKKQIIERGHARLADMAVVNGGHAGFDRRQSIAFYKLGSMKNTGSPGSYVKRCSVYNSFNTGINIERTSDVLLEDNAAYYTLGSTYHVMYRGNILRRNLAIRTVNEYTHNDGVARSNLKNVDYPRFPACFDIKEENEFVNNTAAGSERIGFKMLGGSCTPGVPGTATGCFERLAKPMSGFVSHSCLIGFAVRGGNKCQMFPDMTIWKSWDLAFWAMTMESVKLRNVRIADSKVGLMVNPHTPKSNHHGGGGAFADRYLEVSDALLIGATAGNSDCNENRPK
jgi:hypothetical protein